MAQFKLGEMLVGNGIITHDQLNQALDIQDQKGGAIGSILVHLNYITPDQLEEFIKMQQE